MLRAIGKRLTYANVIASLALFFALGGGAVYAASHQAKQIGAGKLKQNAVTAGKIKANAVTQAKIRNNAVTNAKLREGSVSLAKIAAGTNVVGTTTSAPIAVNGPSAVPVTFAAPLSFTPTAGGVYMLSVEARATNLARSGTEPCRVTVVPLVNGAEWGTATPLVLSAFAPTPEAPAGVVPAAGQTSPIGLTATGVTQTIGAKLIGGPRCASTSSATVAVAITQLK
ncbi:MAG TPA: hypothetical protein VMF55_14280 [Solirubrobacterales bacterium]|nr:hypothetical protein [Solirubrobacterales bacterium]